ncbi:hypothetical protein OSTOST_02864, partial [Ostertagia ostertagi]
MVQPTTHMWMKPAPKFLQRFSELRSGIKDVSSLRTCTYPDNDDDSVLNREKAKKTLTNASGLSTHVCRALGDKTSALNAVGDRIRAINAFGDRTDAMNARGDKKRIQCPTFPCCQRPSPVSDEDDKNLFGYCSHHHIKFKFIPALVPWQGRVYERMIKFFEVTFKAAIRNTKVELEEFSTSAKECEAIVNCGPITYDYNDIDSGYPLRPSSGFLLIGQISQSCGVNPTVQLICNTK